LTALETDRLAIRNFHADDWRDLHEMIVQYQASEYAQYDHQWPTGMDEIKGIAEWFAEGDSYLAVCLKTTGKLVGFIALNRREKQDDLEFGLGYVFNADYHGRGYATEGCRAVLDYAFGQLGADRVSTGTAAANHPSCRLLRRLGLRETGQGTSSFRKTQEGKPIEFVSLSFAISRDEWLTHRQASNHDSTPFGQRKTW
jgi:RimJ/RimL family protein N-acetyltransferase